MNLINQTEWNRSNTDIFWAEIAPCDHVVQIYENDAVFLDALAGFVGGGINAGECVILIASETHLNALEKRLKSFGVRVDTLIKDDRYIPLNAEETLSKFMVNGWPDEDLFNKTVSDLINRAGLRNRRVRAFGEMVAVLWAQGLAGATVNLEHLWNKFCEKQAFSLFCAYPKSGFTQDINESINNICGCHSKMIHGANKSLTEVLYRNTN
jgi:DcmR-like sensory protein